MTSRFNREGGALFFCLVFSLIINTKALALDKRLSAGLSHYIMAVMYEDIGEIERAIREYKEAIKADDKSSAIRLNLASSYIKNNNIPQAIEDLKVVAKLEPEAVEPHAILMLLYSSQNKPDLATIEYEIALKNASKIQPKNIDIYRNLGAVYLHQRKFKEAENTYKLILDLSPNDSQAHFYLGTVYEELKNRDAAIKELKKALELNPGYHEALNYLGYLYVEENKNLDEAQVMIKKALEIEPNNGAYIDSLGWLYFKRGNLEGALKEVEKASTLIEDPVVYDHLGDIYFKIGNKESARLNWEKSLKLDPKQDKVKEKLEKVK